jgi:Ca2+:H+ antiporter
LEPSLPVLHLSRTFAGLVIAAIAGNAAENVASIVQAARGRADLAIALVENSVSQVAVFLFPLLVLVSLAFSTHLTFVVNPAFIGALVLMAISLWQITGDGHAYAFEGAALIALYAILALTAFYD